MILVFIVIATGSILNCKEVLLVRIYTSSGKQFFEATRIFGGFLIVSLDKIRDFSYEYLYDEGFDCALCVSTIEGHIFIYGTIDDVKNCFLTAGVFDDYKYLFCI